MGRGRAYRIPHDGTCSYCGRAFGTIVLWRGRQKHLTVHFDHLLPKAANGSDSTRNVVASCQVCNQLKGSRVFESFADARLYVLGELDRLGVVELVPAEAAPVQGIPCARDGCENHVVSPWKRTRFCSDECRRATYEKEHPRFRGLCLVCGEPLFGNKGKQHCGAACRARALRKRKQKPHRRVRPRTWEVADKAALPLEFLQVNALAVERAVARGEPPPGLRLFQEPVEPLEHESN